MALGRRSAPDDEDPADEKVEGAGDGARAPRPTSPPPVLRLALDGPGDCGMAKRPKFQCFPRNASISCPRSAIAEISWRVLV